MEPAVMVGRPISQADLSRSFGFYFRWALDNVTEMLYRTESEFEWETAQFLYDFLMSEAYAEYRASYQRRRGLTEATAPSLEG